MKAYLMHRDVNPAYGTTEWWKTEDDNVLKVDFYAYVRETNVFHYDTERDRVEHWKPLGIWHKDMTGGKAMRELGYEPIEEDEDGTD